MTGQSTRVIKLGGSLLDDGGWPERFRRWLASQPPMRNVLVVGGGVLVDAIRRWDQTHRLSPSHAHWLAIDAMSVTSKLANSLLRESQWTDEWQSVLDFVNADSCDVAPLIFDPKQFLKAIEPTLGGALLPASWDVTSDSISARIAQVLRADELALLKSCLPTDAAATIELASEANYVDRAFQRFAGELSRSPPMP